MSGSPTFFGWAITTDLIVENIESSVVSERSQRSVDW
jgi:hypothetical protein